MKLHTYTEEELNTPCSNCHYTFRYHNNDSKCQLGTTKFSPPKSPEDLRVEANLKLKEEWEKEKFELEFFNHNYPDKGWKKSVFPEWKTSYLEYRRKPTPAYIPWTYETCPLGTIVQHKERKIQAIITEKYYGTCYVQNRHMTYEKLFANFLIQSSGRPCGTLQ